MPHYPRTGRAESIAESDRLRPLVLVALGAEHLTYAELAEQSDVPGLAIGTFIRGGKLPAKHHLKIQTWLAGHARRAS